MKLAPAYDDELAELYNEERAAALAALAKQTPQRESLVVIPFSCGVGTEADQAAAT